MPVLRCARPLLACGALAALLALGSAPRLALAQDDPPAAAPNPLSGTAAPVPPGTPGAQATRSYEVEGFRSAKFGMTEPEVRKAIQVDFNIRESAIAREINPLERTTILTVTARDVLPEIGTVRIHYILGYSHKKLIQVVLLWGAGVSDTAPNATNILQAAQLLGNYFLGQSFAPESRVLNAQLADGQTLLFRGSDQKGRMVQLLYGLVPQPQPEGERRDAKKSPPRLPRGQLSYIEDPQNPDVFRIKPGQF